jgi:hypothetical protein
MIKYITLNNTKIALADDDDFLISSIQDAVDMLGEAYMENCNRIVVWEKNLHTDFFRLSTGLAGDILQKFSNYKIKLAIIGEFSKYKSKSLQDFIRESNNGNSIFFVGSLEEATEKLT